MAGRTIASLTLLGALLLPAASQARETIVGVWKPVGEQKCWPAHGAIQIEPLGLIDHDIVCRFDTVSRKSDVVTWKGTCQNVEDEKPERVTVVATLRNKFLTLSTNGHPWQERMVRCSGNKMDGSQ